MIFCLFICFMFWLRSFKSDVFSWNSMQERSDWALKEAWELELLGITTTTRQTLALLEARKVATKTWKVEMHSFTLSTPKRNPTEESNPKLQVTRFHFKWITYSQKCVFSRIHTIKKKRSKKKGWKLWKPNFSNHKNHKNPQNLIKSTQRPKARTTRPAEITSPEPSAAPPLPAEPEAISETQTNSGVWMPKRTFFGDVFLILEFLRILLFPCFSFSDCIWLWLYLVVFVSTVGGFTMFLCSFNRPTPPTWPPSSLAIWPPSSLGWKPAVIIDPFGWMRTEVNNGE